MFKDVATLGTGKNAGEAPIGDWLTITIDKATLCTVDQYQVVDGTEQDNKYTTTSSSNIKYENDNGRNAQTFFTGRFHLSHACSSSHFPAPLQITPVLPAIPSLLHR